MSPCTPTCKLLGFGHFTSSKQYVRTPTLCQKVCAKQYSSQLSAQTMLRLAAQHACCKQGTYLAAAQKKRLPKPKQFGKGNENHSPTAPCQRAAAASKIRHETTYCVQRESESGDLQCAH